VPNLTFPTSPSLNDLYTFAGKTWIWNGQAWELTTQGSINGIVIGNTSAAAGNFTTVGATVFSGNVYANSILPWSASLGLIDDAVDIGNSTLFFRDIYVGNVITPAGDQGNATQIQPASGAGQSGVAFVDAITGSASDVSAGTLYVESIDATGNIIVDTFVEANEIIALSNVSGTGGNFSANVTASYFLGNGAFLTGISGSSSYGNANVADYLGNGFTGNIGNGNTQDNTPIFNGVVYAEDIFPLGGLTTVDIGTTTNPFARIYTNDGFYVNNGTGNFAVTIASGYDNVNGVKLQNFATAQWSNLFVGNVNAATGITTAGNVTAGYFLGNGALLSGISTNYSNANVADYLPTYTGAINSLTGNVTTTANVQGAYILGNGYFLSSVGGGSAYGNANVAVFLTTYTGNLSAGNISAGNTTVNGNLIVAGNISATGNLTYINVQDLVIDDPLILLAANNPGDTEDLGIVAGYFNGSNLHTGFARDYTDKTWKVFEGVSSEPNTVIAWSQAVFAPLKAGNITANGTIIANANISGGNIVLSNFASINEGNIRGFSIGYRDIPQVSWTGTPTLGLSDAGKHYYNSAGGVTLTVPDDSSVNFPLGAAVTLINQSSSNSTIVPGSGVSIYLAGNSTITVTANRTMTSNAFGTIVKVSANTWFLSGANIT